MMPFSLITMLLLSGCWWNPRQCSTTKSPKSSNEELFVSCWPTVSQLPVQVNTEHLWVWHHRGGRLMEYRNGALVLKENQLHCFHVDPRTLSRFSEHSEPKLVHLLPNESGALRWAGENGQIEISVSDLRIPVSTLESDNAMLLILPN